MSLCMPPCCRAHALVVDGNRQFHPALRVGPREDTRLPKLLLVNLWDVLAGVTLEAAEQAFTDCFAEMCDDFRVEVYRRMFDVEVDGDLVPDDPLVGCIRMHYDMFMTLGVCKGPGSVTKNTLETVKNLVS